MLMAQAAREKILDGLVVAAAGRRYLRRDYLKRVVETMRVARRGAFALDCFHLAELEGLADMAMDEVTGGDEEYYLTPAMFDKVLSVLRGYVSYDYYKGFSHIEFERRFRRLRALLGGKWSHRKFTRLLGLHITGRLQKRFDFRRAYRKYIDEAARSHRSVPRRWIEEIIWIESGGDPRAVSRAGAFGLMQVMPGIFMGQGEKRAESRPFAFEQSINPLNPRMNIKRGAAFLERLLKSLRPHMRGYGYAMRRQIVFHAYNGGIGRVIRLLKKHGPAYKRYLPRETRSYLKLLYDFPARRQKSQSRAGTRVQ
jgi:hypothetical protein